MSVGALAYFTFFVEPILTYKSKKGRRSTTGKAAVPASAAVFGACWLQYFALRLRLSAAFGEQKYHWCMVHTEISDYFLETATQVTPANLTKLTRMSKPFR